ncbi:EAL domain-containing protein [Massilia arenae]|nr:EAL domain-containing protein [Massilia arenae]
MGTTEIFLIAMAIIVSIPYLIWRLGDTDYYAPLVVVQIITGILLGPGILGKAYPEYYNFVFNPEVIQSLNGIAWWAVMIFVMIAGIELDLKAAWAHRRESMITASLALGTPLVFGCVAALGMLGYAGWIGPKAASWQFVLGVGLACAVTALPILILLMEKLEILRQPIGQRILRYASLDDIAIWGVLALILLDWDRVGRQLGFLAVFALATVLFRKLMVKLQERDRWHVSLIWLTACSFAADWAGPMRSIEALHSSRYGKNVTIGQPSHKFESTGPNRPFFAKGSTFLLRQILLLLLLGFALLAQAVAAPRVVRVGVYANPPKLYPSGEGQAEGILVDMLREVAKAEGWELRFIQCQWTQCLAALNQGSIDLLPDVAWSEERSRQLDFHQVPALYSWSQVFRRTGVALSSMTDIGGKRVAILSDSIQQRYFTDFAKEFGVKPQVVPVASIAEGFDLVATGKADAVVASHFVGAFHATGRGIVATPILFQPTRLYYAAGKGLNGNLLAAFDRRLGAWQANPDSVYFAILERWQSRGVLAQIPAYLRWTAGLVLVLLLVALGTTAWLRRQNLRKSGRLRETEQRLGTILDSVDSLIYIKDAACRYTYANQALRTFLGRDNKDIVGHSDIELFAPGVAAEIGRNDQRTIVGRQRVVSEETVPDAHGRQVTVLTTKIPLFNEDGSVGGLCGISFDISERRAAEESNRVAATVFQSAEGMFIAGRDRRILRVNEAYCMMTGYSAGELAGGMLPPCALSREGSDAGAAMWKAAEAEGKWQGEIWTSRKDGSTYPARLTVTAVRDSSGSITHYVGTQGDITAQKTAQDEIVRLAYSDPLTGLANRRMLLERLHHAMPLHQRAGQIAALLFLDLDNFKDLNDLRGHGVGDRLLLQVAKRISACTRACDTVARIGGDEFVVLLENVGRDEQEAAHHAAMTGKKILDALREPFDIDGMTHHATCSLGAALSTEGAIDTLMKRGDMAMYRAKHEGKNTLCFFHLDMETEVNHRLALERELRESLGSARFALHYQPQVDGAGRISGAEALLRWTSSAGRQVSPVEFIPVAEASGLIVPLGRWALRAACGQLARWHRIPAMGHMSVAVNVSVHQFREPGFVSEVLDIVSESGIDPRLLKLELTETVLIDDVDDTVDKMLRLKAHGIGFALDDFGTGYSSLSYLKRLPLDQLKIDRSFVRDILENPNDASIARSIVALSQSLGLGIIAEGVETQAQRAFLAKIGCGCCQGYLFGRPMEATALEELVAAQVGEAADAHEIGGAASGI